MRKNEYNNIDEFVFEYSKGRESSEANERHRRRFMGIEFLFNDVYYRLCREPYDKNDNLISADEENIKYNLMIMHCEKTLYPVAEYFESVGWYRDLNDALENYYIDGRKFADVIMDDNTIILSKD